jgi:hypothetical protein
MASNWIMGSDQPLSCHGGARTGRQTSLAVCWRDRQGIKITENGRIARHDAGKKIKARKPHILADTLGLTVGPVIHSADIQDCGGATVVLETIPKRWPWHRHIFTGDGMVEQS